MDSWKIDLGRSDLSKSRTRRSAIFDDQQADKSQQLFSADDEKLQQISALNSP
jgi:hypothetical protein